MKRRGPEPAVVAARTGKPDSVLRRRIDAETGKKGALGAAGNRRQHRAPRHEAVKAARCANLLAAAEGARAAAGAGTGRRNG